jgi:hypothetical protein
MDNSDAKCMSDIINMQRYVNNLGSLAGPQNSALPFGSTKVNYLNSNPIYQK